MRGIHRCSLEEEKTKGETRCGVLLLVDRNQGSGVRSRKKRFSRPRGVAKGGKTLNL